MKLKSLSTLCITLLLFACSESENREEETAPIVKKYVYFLNEEIIVNRMEETPITTTVRYDGEPFEGAIRIPYTLTSTSSNGAIENEDYLLPNGSGIFEVVEGASSTNVTLLETLLPNPRAENRRSLTVELKSASGVTIGSESDGSGTLLEIIIEPDS